MDHEYFELSGPPASVSQAMELQEFTTTSGFLSFWKDCPAVNCVPYPEVLGKMLAYLGQEPYTGLSAATQDVSLFLQGDLTGGGEK